MGDNDRNYVFASLKDVLFFARWVEENFDSPDEYEMWFVHSLDTLVPPDLFCTRPPRQGQKMHNCNQCSAQFGTKSGLDVHTNVVHNRKVENSQFWDIVRNAYKDHNEDQHESEIPDTD